MRGIYTAGVSITGLGAAKTLLLLQVPSTRAIEILSAAISNGDNETNEQLRAAFQRVSSVGSPAGTSVTPSKHEPGDQASSLTVLGNLTAEPTTYDTASKLAEAGFATLAGWVFQPSVEERIVVGPSGQIGLVLLNGPTSFNAIARVTWREIG